MQTRHGYVVERTTILADPSVMRRLRALARDRGVSLAHVKMHSRRRRPTFGMDLGFVDASVITLTEHLREPKVATLDHRHFSAVRPSHVKALQLLPS